VTDQGTPPSADARSVIDRMKRAAGARTDAELAAVLGVTKGAVPNWRKQGVPPKHLGTLADRYQVTIEWLRSGRGWQPGAIVDALGRDMAPVDGALLAVALERAAQQWAAANPGQEMTVFALGERAAELYNGYRLLWRGDEEQRSAMLEGMIISLRPFLHLRLAKMSEPAKVDGEPKVDG
jgi:hypothetical protein